MKRFAFTLILALACLVSVQAAKHGTKSTSASVSSVAVSNDSVEIRDGDTYVRVSKALLGKEISRLLNDTVISLKVADNRNPDAVAADSVNAAENAADVVVEDSDGTEFNDEYYLEQERRIQETVIDIVRMCVVGIVLVVFVALFFHYLHRRRKYRMVERAISANYPLPEGLFGASAQSQPQTIYINQIPGTPVPPQTPDTAESAPSGMQMLSRPNAINWRAFKGAFVWSIIGIGVMLFFGAAGADPMVAIGAILLLVGLAKGFLCYQDQRNGYLMTGMPMPPQQPVSPMQQSGQPVQGVPQPEQGETPPPAPQQ